MPRYNVEYNNKWAAFSSISSGFITEFMNKEDYENWRKEEYGSLHYEPAEKCNMMAIEDAVYEILLNYFNEDFEGGFMDKLENDLIEAGLNENDIINIEQFLIINKDYRIK